MSDERCCQHEKCPGGSLCCCQGRPDVADVVEEPGAFERFVNSFNGDEAGDIDHVRSVLGDTGWAMRGGNDVRAVFDKAVAALAAFEQAHAPSDEREALASLIDDELQSQRIFDLRDMADTILAAGFRRPAQGEPRTEATHRGTFGHVWPCPLFYVGNWQRVENGHEPVRECMNPSACGTPEPQGEPSDAEVEAALNAYWHPLSDWPWRESRKNAMRRALRAAGEVKR